MGDMADWQIENMLIPEDWENCERQREWARHERIRKAEQTKQKALRGKEVKDD